MCVFVEKLHFLQFHESGECNILFDRMDPCCPHSIKDQHKVKFYFCMGREATLFISEEVFFYFKKELQANFHVIQQLDCVIFSSVAILTFSLFQLSRFWCSGISTMQLRLVNNWKLQEHWRLQSMWLFHSLTIHLFTGSCLDKVSFRW